MVLAACLTFLSMVVTDKAQAQATDPDELRIGLLAHRGWQGIDRYWSPLATYIGDALDTQVRFVPVTLASAGPLIENGALEFLITNPGHYVALEKRQPMSVIATLSRRLSDGSLQSEFGSAIVTLASSDIATLKDTAGKHVTAVDPRAFGGFQVAWLEFTAQAIDPFTDFRDLAFVGFPQDRILEDVLDGRTDAGIVRSGLIETLAAEGRLDPARLRVLNSNANFTHPDALSTRLYPEWPFLAMAGTSAALRDRLALALLQTQHPEIRARHGLRDGWGAPRSYHAVRTLDAAYLAATAPTSSVGLLTRPVMLAFLAAAGLLAALALLTLRRRRETPAPVPDTEAFDDTPAPPQVQLTQRESEILALVTRGLSSKEIARSLGISPKTVEFHRSNLLRKHDAKSAVDLVRKTAATAENAGT